MNINSDSLPRKGILLKQQNRRLPLVIGVMALLFAVLAGRLVQLGQEHHQDARLKENARTNQAMSRPEIQDRHGEILAIDVPTSSLYADPQHLISVDETAEKLVGVLPDLNADDVRHKLSANRRFVWLKRFLTPDERKVVFDLGLPGLYFLKEPKRFYPVGEQAAAVTGYVDADNKGLDGIELSIDNGVFKATTASDQSDGEHPPQKPIMLSIDLRIQHAVAIELQAAIDLYKAKAGAGVVLDINTGEILALSSLPSFDPLERSEALKKENVDRARRSIYELGSVLKCFTVAMGLDEGAVEVGDRFDVATPIKLGSFVIRDDHKTEDGTMSLEEVFTHSSNVGAARIAQKVGVEKHRTFLSRVGLLDRLETEAGATETPNPPPKWGPVENMSTAYGYGLSVAPLQLATAAMPLFNGGFRLQPTFRRVADGKPLSPGLPVLKSETSRIMRRFMRENVLHGTGRRADVPAYHVGGKTGTARKAAKGGYSNNLITSFLAIFPAEKPRYLSYVMLDEPQKVPESRGQDSASVNAAPLTAHIIARVAPLLGVKPAQNADN